MSWSAATFTLEPVHPTTDDIVRLRIDITETTCENIEFASQVDAAAKAVQIVLNFPDFCDLSNPAHTAPTRHFDIGRLTAGVHHMDFVGCHNVPPPAPSCTVFRTEQLTVSGFLEPIPIMIPATSRWALLYLTIGVVLVGTAYRRFR